MTASLRVGLGAPIAVSILLMLAWILPQLEAPLVEDSLFWWVPQALSVAEQGPWLHPPSELPLAVQQGLGPVPPQWGGGLPDYAHPPLWIWWLGLWLGFGAQVELVHLACLPLALLGAVGWVRLAARLGNPWAGLAIYASPPLLAQWLRPELDLPLLALVPWALSALMDGRWWAYAAWAALATWCKEPGVLLAAAGLLRCLQERRWRWPALAPLLALAFWMILHGDPARPERLPADPWDWLGDLVLALRLVGWEQGRLLLVVGLGQALWSGRSARQPWALAGGMLATWVLFFSAVGFFAGRGQLDLHTHVRYFGPALALLGVMGAQRWPALALLGLLWWRSPSAFGPEASTWGVDAGRVERQAAEWLCARRERVWVGSYQAAGLGQAWSGLSPGCQPDRIELVGPETIPEQLQPGDLLMIPAYGEPTGRLERGLQLEEVERWRAGHAELRAMRVVHSGGW